MGLEFEMEAESGYFLLFLFSYALILFRFENRRFSFVLPAVLKTFSFATKTEGFLNHKSYGKTSVFLQNWRKFKKEGFNFIPHISRAASVLTYI